MGKEWNTCSGDGNDLLWRNVDEVHEFSIDDGVVFIVTGDDFLIEDLAHHFFFIGAGWIDGGEFDFIAEVDLAFSDIMAAFVIGGQILSPGFGHIGLAVDVIDDAIWGHDETILVDLRIGAEVIDQTNVLTFWRFDWTDTAVMGVVNVTNFHGGAITGKTARA